jgi:hypothetical protein
MLQNGIVAEIVIQCPMSILTDACVRGYGTAALSLSIAAIIGTNG